MTIIEAVFFGASIACIIFVSAVGYAKYNLNKHDKTSTTITYATDDPRCISCPEYKLYCSGCKKYNY